MTEVEMNKERYYEEIYQAAKNNDREAFRDLFLRLHDKDQHEVFHLLYPENKKKIADFLKPEEFADIFEWMELKDQEEAVQYLPDDFITKVFDHVAADNAAHFLAESETTDNQALLKIMNKEKRTRVNELLSYAPETAGSIMTTEFISVLHSQTLSEVIETLRKIGNKAETIYYLYVVDNKNHLVGVLSLRDLILSPETETVENIMFTQVISVKDEDDQEKVARVIQDYDLLAVPVISEHQVILGIITVDDVMDILEDEMTEDFSKFSAIQSSEEGETTVLHTARSRVPWIIILIFLGMITAALIGHFEDTLNSVVALAAFIPLIMDTAGNVGTQALAVAVRRLTVEDEKDRPKLLDTIKKELGVGILLGLASALVLSGIVIVLYGNWILAFIISLSVFLTLSISTMIGTTIPVIMTKLKIDPAVASGPFITTINDSLGLIIYFSIATFLLEHL